MGEMKTIISANIPVSVAKELNTKTKGTRSRVVTRALKAYLADREAFNLEDIETESLLLELQYRKELTKSQCEILRQIWLELRE
tara:strand:- start:1424 stop:1675 length:252 start_codon:yes stop_codon:yes gene_type:complete